MVADQILSRRLDQLMTLFNRRSMDLPDGLFDRRAQFLLNGTAFEAMLGRAPDDPLVLMLARGPAGYRFAIKALQHALPDCRAHRGDIGDAGASDEGLSISIWISGRLRGQGQPVETEARARVTVGTTGSVIRAEVAMEPGVVNVLREARLRD
jgi:hypothetical protein